MIKNKKSFTPFRNRRSPKNNLFLTGFTLVEAMIAIGIFAFVITAVYGVLGTGRRLWLTGEALVKTQESARNGLSRITRELRHSVAAHVTVTNTLFGDTADSVEFDIPIDADADGAIDLVPGTNMIVFGAADTAGFEIEFQLDPAKAQIIRRLLDNTGAEVSRQIVANNISALSFLTETGGVGTPNEAVNITLTSEINTMQERAINPPITVTLRSRVNLRN